MRERLKRITDISLFSLNRKVKGISEDLTDILKRGYRKNGYNIIIGEELGNISLKNNTTRKEIKISCICHITSDEYELALYEKGNAIIIQNNPRGKEYSQLDDFLNTISSIKDDFFIKRNELLISIIHHLEISGNIYISYGYLKKLLSSHIETQIEYLFMLEKYIKINNTIKEEIIAKLQNNDTDPVDLQLYLKQYKLKSAEELELV